MKFKEWNFDKYFRATDMKIIVSKDDKRASEGKETIFYSSGQEINAERIENFKKRIKLDGIEMPSPSAGKMYHILVDIFLGMLTFEARNTSKYHVSYSTHQPQYYLGRGNR
jgi:hypothetical protein